MLAEQVAQSLAARDCRSEGYFEPWICPFVVTLLGLSEIFNHRLCPLSSELTGEWTQAAEQVPDVSVAADVDTPENSAQT